MSETKTIMSESKYNVKTDVHTHSLASKHAYSTIEENINAAKEQGLELIGITDHFGNMIDHYNDPIAFQYLLNLKILPDEWKGVKLAKGVEADIVDLDGNLFGYNVMVDENIVGDKVKKETLQEKMFLGVDYIIASIHAKDFAKDATPLQITKMYIKALEKDKVKILGHIGRTGFDMDYKEVLLAAKAMGKFIEFNEHSFNFKNGDGAKRCKIIAGLCAELGVGATVSSDAHSSFSIGKYNGVYEMLSEVDFPPELIVNSDAESFLKAIKP